MDDTLVKTPDRGQAEDPALPPGGPRHPGRHGWIPLGLRLASHGVVWTVVLVPTVIQMDHGWRATRDDAMISIGSYRVFSSHSPTVGVWSQASQGMHHAFYDLGPLLFWLLAVPVRLDPSQGALWGAAVLCGAALSLAVEASWSVAGWPAGAAVALVAADLGWQTQFFADLVWNPHFGLVFMVATVATAWAVATGRYRWWPLVVGCASVAAQCHLLYAVTAVALVVASPVIGLVNGRRPLRWRWAVVGLVVGAACWAVPLVQEVVGRPGNLTLVLGSGKGHARVGISFGLHALATAVAPRPVWLTSFPFLSVPRYVDSHTSVWAVVSLVLLVAVALGARRARRAALGALAAVALITAAGAAASYAALPRDDIIVVSYLGIYLWAVGAVVWIVLVWAVGEVVVSAARRWQRSGVPGGWSPLVRRGLEFAGLALLVVGCTEAVRSLEPAAHARTSAVAYDRPLDDALALSVERTVPLGPVAVTVRPATFGPRHGNYVVDYWGMAFVLLADGWQPGLNSGFFGVATHLTVPPGSRWPEVTAIVDPADKAIRKVTRGTVGRVG